MKKTWLVLSTIFMMLIFFNSADAQHRKLSDQGRGAIIGGAGGAVAGGLIGHGVGGALLGGAIGAGGGYVIGNEHHKNVVRRRHAYYRAHHYSHTYARH